MSEPSNLSQAPLRLTVVGTTIKEIHESVVEYIMRFRDKAGSAPVVFEIQEIKMKPVKIKYFWIKDLWEADVTAVLYYDEDKLDGS